MPFRPPSRRPAVAVIATVAALALLPVATAAAPQRTAGSVAPAGDDPLAVYFRHDAVGRSQLALAVTTCGTERWTVKTGTDDDRDLVGTVPRDVTIRFLRRLATPASKPQTARVAPAETTVYRLHARLQQYVREDDGDYHLVLSDLAGRTIIAEIPAPSCVGAISPFKSAIRTARRHMNNHYGVTTDFKTTNRKVVVRGIGFFDFFHGQTGMAPNDLELHPVIALRFV
jgi:hypothetical protein